MKVEILALEDLKTYKALIDECFGSGNDLEQYEKYHKTPAYTIFVVIIILNLLDYTTDLDKFHFQLSALRNDI